MSHFTRPHRLLLAVGLLAGATAACAAGTTFEIAGVKVTFAESDWVLHDAQARAGQIGNGGIQGNVPRQARLAVRQAADGSVLAALMVSASRGSTMQLIIEGGCDPAPVEAFYSRSLAVKADDPPHCLYVSVPVAGEQMARIVGQDLGDALRNAGLKMPEASYRVLAFARNGLAADVVVDGFVAVGLVGLPATPVGPSVPPRLPAPVAAWGDALGATVGEGLKGVFSREAKLPPVEFAR